MKAKNFLKGAVLASLLTAGAAFFISKKVSPKTQAQAKKTVVDLTKKIIARLRDLKSMSKSNFDTVVEAVIDEYEKGKKMSGETAKEIKRELKSQWKTIEKELKSEPAKDKTRGKK